MLIKIDQSPEKALTSCGPAMHYLFAPHYRTFE
jgi:hypothetical protein